MTPDQDYQLFEVASNAFSDDELINTGLSIARNTVNSLLKSLKQPPPVGVRVYGYADQQVNAMAMKADGIYKIALSTATLTHIFHWYAMWFKSPNMKELFRNRQNSYDILIKKLYAYSMAYIASHEFFHIMNGHCDIPEKMEHFVSEKIDIHCEEQHFFNQVLEFDADRAAVKSCTYGLLSVKNTYTNLFSDIGLLSFALYNVFLIFQNESKIGFDDYIKHVFYIKDHPYDGIRFSYSLAFIMDVLLQIFQQQIVINQFAIPTAETLVTFEKQVLGVPEVKNCLFSASFTNQGVQHTMDLNNAWNDVAEKLRPYAYVPLAKGEYISEMYTFMDDAGHFYEASEAET